MKISLDVSSHCVQSAAKSLHEALVRALFKAGAGEAETLEEKIEALKLFLETADFPALRSSHSALAGGSAQTVILEIDEQGGFTILLEGVRVAVPVGTAP